MIMLFLLLNAPAPFLERIEPITEGNYRLVADGEVQEIALEWGSFFLMWRLDVDGKWVGIRSGEWTLSKGTLILDYGEINSQWDGASDRWHTVYAKRGRFDLKWTGKGWFGEGYADVTDPRSFKRWKMNRQPYKQD